jgi:acyl carrier protein
MNWDTWQFQEEKEQITAISKDLAHLAMTPEEGIEAFDRILSGGTVDQVILSTTDLSARIDHWRKARRSAQASTEDTSLPLHPRPQLRSSYVAPSSELERAITNVWQRAFGVEQIGVHDNFFDLGGDSLIAVRVISQLNKELSTDISVVSLYEGLTISSLVELLSPANRDKPSPRFEVDILEEKALQRKRYQEKQRLRRRETVA